MTIRIPCDEIILYDFYQKKDTSGVLASIFKCLLYSEIDNFDEKIYQNKIQDNKENNDGDLQLLSAFVSKDNESDDEFEARYVETIQITSDFGNPISSFVLGSWWDDGVNAEDKKNAFKFYKYSAEWGFAPAMAMCGIMMIYGDHKGDGTGWEINREYGLELIHTAKSLGDDVAIDFLDCWEE